VNSRQIRQFFRDLNLHNAIITRHPNSSPPATCHRNENRVQIDGIYCSIGIVPITAGLLNYGGGTPSDHRVLWADFRKVDIIGARAADYRPPVIGLRALNPRDVHWYHNTRSFAKLQAAKVLSDLLALSKIEPTEFTQVHRHESNRLQQVNRDIRVEVRQTVRHVYRGSQHFPPEWRRTLQARQLWIRVVAYKRHHRTGKQVKLTQIHRLMRVTYIPDALSVTEHEAVSHLNVAKEAYFVSVMNNVKLRDAYLLSQDEAKVAANGSTVDIERKKRRTTKRQRDAGRKLSQLKQVNFSPVTKLQTTVDGVTHMWETKDEVELAYIAEGQSRFSQTIRTPAMEEWIVTLVGFAAEKETAQHILDGVFRIPSQCDPYLRKFLQAVRQPEATIV
jgi:hypothetical protein